MRLKATHYLLFLMALAALSAVLVDKNIAYNTPSNPKSGLLPDAFRAIGNLFQSTIHG